jgi:hypothetical protein
MDRLEEQFRSGVVPSRPPKTSIQPPPERGTVLEISPLTQPRKHTPPPQPEPSPFLPPPPPRINPAREEAERRAIILDQIQYNTRKAVEDRDWEYALLLKEEADKLRDVLRASGFFTRATLPQNDVADRQIEQHWQRVQAERARTVDEGVIQTLLIALEAREALALRLEAERDPEAARAEWRAADDIRRQLVTQYHYAVEELPPTPRLIRRKLTNDPRKEELLDQVEKREATARQLEADGDYVVADVYWKNAEVDRAELRVLGVPDWEQPPKPPKLPSNPRSETHMNNAREKAIRVLDQQARENAPLDPNGPIPEELKEAAVVYLASIKESEQLVQELDLLPEGESRTQQSQRLQVYATLQRVEKRGKAALALLTRRGAQFLVLSKEAQEEDREELERFRRTGEL